MSVLTRGNEKMVCVNGDARVTVHLPMDVRVAAEVLAALGRLGFSIEVPTGTAAHPSDSEARR